MSDQPFMEVENPEFIGLLNNVCHSGPLLDIPGQKAVQWHAMNMGAESVDEVKTVFAVCSAFISNKMPPMFPSEN